MPEELEEILNESTQEDEATINFSIFAIAYFGSIFAERIEQEIGILRTAGMSDSGIIRTLSADLDGGGRIFGEYSRSIKRGIVLGIMQGFRVGQDAIYGDSVKFRWVSVGSPNICPDCESRINQVLSWEDWEAEGLPASGFSVCKENCYCQLIPEDVEIDNPVIVQGSGAESIR
tara:strand:- start:3232 stop:3753 length:522 start_codon:yes stop_codon:yes gene_type:complete